MYDIHPRGVYALRHLGKKEIRSVDGEEFAKTMQELYEKVKHQPEVDTSKHKKRAYLKRREIIFEVGDLVLSHLRKERFPKSECNKLKLEKIGPSKDFRKFSSNTYEIKCPSDIGISPIIFNISDF